MLRQSIGKGIRKKKKKFCRNISFYTVYKILLANAPFRQMSIIEVLTCFEGPDFFFPLNYALMHPALQDTAATTAGQRNNVLQPSQEHHTHAG